MNLFSDIQNDNTYISKISKIKHPIYNIPGMNRKKILVLTLKNDAFEITGTIEKKFELRTKTDWITSRLFVKSKDTFILYPKIYDYVLLINGYSNKSPFKLMKFINTEIVEESKIYSFSNKLQFKVLKNDYKINLGNITITGNDI